MHQMVDLKNLERKAFRSAYQDGLWDIYVGGVLVSMAIMMSATNSENFPILQFSVSIVGLIISFFIFRAGKKFITTPRLGQVKFGPQRQRRKRVLALVLAGIVLMQVGIVIATILMWQNPDGAANTGVTDVTVDLERLVVAMVGALFVGPSIALIAYFNDFNRGYYIAFITSLGVFLMIWFEAPVYLIAAALLVIIPGVILLIRFIRDYPLPPAGVTNG